MRGDDEAVIVSAYPRAGAQGAVRGEALPALGAQGGEAGAAAGCAGLDTAVNGPIVHADANRAYRLRQLPPLKIPVRTATERLVKRFTAAEIRAIEQAISAGRVQRIRRGVRGLGARRFRDGISVALPQLASGARAQILARLRLLQSLAKAA
jgi:hypothetical protein